MRFNKTHFVGAGFLTVICTSSFPTFALQEDNTSRYDAGFFSQYQPQNAMEMILRLPGFNFDEGSDARGFGANAGNVLIDGTRPSSKSGGLEGALIRIPAEQVKTIEIVRGGINGGDAGGQSIVANIIRNKNITSGTWALKFRQTQNTDTLPNIEAALTTQMGQWQTAFDTDIGGNPAYRNALIEEFDNNNSLNESANEVFKDSAKWAFFNGEAFRELADGKFTVNGRIGGDKWQGNTHRDIFIASLPTASASDSTSDLVETNKFSMAELSLDWKRTANDWKLSLMALGVINDKNYENSFNENNLNTLSTEHSQFKQDKLKSEFIMRTAYGKVSNTQLSPEFGIELTKNKLDTSLESFENGIVEDLDNANVVVTEIRGELFANIRYEYNDNLSFEGGLTTEFSKIEVNGDATNEESFQFFKPRLSSTYNINDEALITFEAQHRVGQLDFNDFAASDNAEDGKVLSGNPELVPEQISEFITTYHWGFSEKGSLKVKAFHEWRKDILEEIKLPNEGQGLGNAGDARFWGMITDLTFALDPWLKNGLIEITHKIRRSDFDDPIIQNERDISDYTPDWLTFKLRQDLTKHKFSWGVEYWGHYTDTDYLVDEIRQIHGNKRVRVFIETTQYFGLKTQLEVTNINTGRFTRTRSFYEPDRGGQYDGYQVAHRIRKPQIKLSFWGTF